MLVNVAIEFSSFKKNDLYESFDIHFIIGLKIKVQSPIVSYLEYFTRYFKPKYHNIFIYM